MTNICSYIIVLVICKQIADRERSMQANIGGEKMTFGESLQKQRIAKGLSMRELALRAGFTAQYLSDIEYGKRAAPEKDVLDNLINALDLTVDEERLLYDLAAEERNSLAQDIPNYIKGNDIIIRALRTAKDVNAGVEEWQNFIYAMKERNKRD